jgi:hypothetical protein
MKYTYTLLFIFIINNFSSQPSENKHERIKSTNKNTVIKLSEDSLHSTFLIETPVKVPLYYHPLRRENIIVNQGRTLMKLGIDTLTI